MLVNAGTVTTRVSMRTLIYLCFFTYLKILDSLNTLMKVVEEPKSMFFKNDIVVEIIDETTIKKSNMLAMLPK
jgi:hypothetical protein